MEVARLLWFLDLAINCGRKFLSQEQRSSAFGPRTEHGRTIQTIFKDNALVLYTLL